MGSFRLQKSPTCPDSLQICGLPDPAPDTPHSPFNPSAQPCVRHVKTCARRGGVHGARAQPPPGPRGPGPGPASLPSLTHHAQGTRRLPGTSLSVDRAERPAHVRLSSAHWHAAAGSGVQGLTGKAPLEAPRHPGRWPASPKGPLPRRCLCSPPRPGRRAGRGAASETTRQRRREAPRTRAAPGSLTDNRTSV